MRRSITPAKFRNLLGTYAPSTKEYGEPDGITEESLRDIEFPSSPEVTGRRYAKEQLRELGYID